MLLWQETTFRLILKKKHAVFPAVILILFQNPWCFYMISFYHRIYFNFLFLIECSEDLVDCVCRLYFYHLFVSRFIWNWAYSSQYLAEIREIILFILFRTVIRRTIVVRERGICDFHHFHDESFHDSSWNDSRQMVRGTRNIFLQHNTFITFFPSSTPAGGVFASCCSLVFTSTCPAFVNHLEFSQIEHSEDFLGLVILISLSYTVTKLQSFFSLTCRADLLLRVSLLSLQCVVPHQAAATGNGQKSSLVWCSRTNESASRHLFFALTILTLSILK